MTPPDKDELNHIITKIRAGKDPDTGELHITDEEAKQAINRLIAKERLDELKQATVGRVTNRKNAASLTYMSGFGFAANNLQRHKVDRIIELEQSLKEADKEEQ